MNFEIEEATVLI